MNLEEGTDLGPYSIRELLGSGQQSLPQWQLATDILGPHPDGADALKSSVAKDVPAALRLAGCSKQAELWEASPPAGCETGACTVFAAAAADAQLPPAAVSVPYVAIFLDGGRDLRGSEKTADGGTLRYLASSKGSVLRISVLGPEGRVRLEAELQQEARVPLRTRERHRIVYALSDTRLPVAGHIIDVPGLRRGEDVETRRRRRARPPYIWRKRAFPQNRKGGNQ